MILQALYDYYQRKAHDPDPTRRLPAYGLEDKEIPFIIELSADGRPLGITPTKQGDGKKKIAQRYLVPKGVKRSSGVAANLLWDSAEYVLGVDTRGMSDEAASMAAIQAIRDLSARVGIPSGFSQLGVTKADIEGWLDKALADPCAPCNPRTASRDEVRELYLEAL